MNKYVTGLEKDVKAPVNNIEVLEKINSECVIQNKLNWWDNKELPD